MPQTRRKLDHASHRVCKGPPVCGEAPQSPNAGIPITFSSSETPEVSHLQYASAVTRYFSVKLLGLGFTVAPTLATVNPFGQCRLRSLSQGGAVVASNVLPGSLQVAR
ncbi:hypothetical protein XAC3810_430002 [Xanthomonas citri pv. citri]|nr:hypothetical protein XAC1083_430026 [Xanthomonas citri pv. citri]CEE37612.1 hypothetical protein XAC3810_430002 [Xanthomonas citri pv. citri]CEE64756.1 hypothetical protein XACW160_430046 [Xanthomonas citri pv. citri]CEE70261.1 hypothetical protein XAC2852_470027 [Xanthomonas citri pv. citri]CEH53596.1 hypothetical protein XACG102_5220002 [Xanthomonas citri pv. citri]